MTAIRESICPGCGLRMPAFGSRPHDGYYNVSPECWAVYSEVIGNERNQGEVFAPVHPLTVNTYAVQHAGGRHPDDSIAVHLSGLHLTLDRGVDPPDASRMAEGLSGRVTVWPHFPPPPDRVSLTVSDVVLSDSADEHIDTVRAWSQVVWESWSEHHEAVSRFVRENVDL